MTVKTAVLALLFATALQSPFRNLNAQNITDAPSCEKVLEQEEDSFDDIFDELQGLDELDITLEDIENISKESGIKTEPSLPDQIKLAWMFIKFKAQQKTDEAKQHFQDHPEDFVVGSLIAANFTIAAILWWLILRDKAQAK
ncbi:hypothetical protein IPF37_03730 [bacterium]|nr:MAG: hypothetical protein IPF37_03730 [bacterium]